MSASSPAPAVASPAGSTSPTATTATRSPCPSPSTAGELRANPVGHAVELVRKAKAEVDAEYIQSVADHMALRGRPNLAAARVYVVSDLIRVGFGDLDYGWGRPVYGGAASVGPIPGCSSFLVRGRNADSEDGVVVPMWLPGPTMDRFKEEMGKLLRPPAGVPVPRQHQHGVFPLQRSAL